MNKKSIFFAICIASSLFTKAQITFVEYPSDYLSKEKISQILEKSKKNGIQEWEVQKQSEILHRQLKKQNDAIANGSFVQKIIQPPPQVATAGCNNTGFENGTSSGWTFMQGSASTTTVLPCPSCFTNIGGVYEVASINGNSTANNNTGNNISGDVSNTCMASFCPTPEPYTNGIDYYGGFPVVSPSGGNFSLLMNNSNAGYLMQQASQSFIVDASNTSFTFQYAAVLQDGGHPVFDSPYLDVHLTDVTTGSVIPCSNYSVIAANITGGTAPGWLASSVNNTVYYKPWTTVALDLSSIMGHTVTLQVSVSDCNQGGHFGYAYIDANCNASGNQIISSKPLCAVGDTTVLSGPAGYATYNWSGPVTGSSQNLKTGTLGSYTLTTTSASGCLAPVLNYNLTQSSNPTLGITATSSSICSGTGDTLKASGASTYTWTPISSLLNSNTANPTASPTATTIYTVTGTNVGGCVSAPTTVTVTVIAAPTLSLTSNTYTICNGSSQALSVSGASTYTWIPASSLLNQNTVSPTANPTTTTIYTVTGTSGACNSSPQMVTVTVNPTPVIDTTGVTITPAGCGGSLGAISNITITGAPTITYTWTQFSSSGTQVGTGSGNNPTLSNINASNYCLNITDGNTCATSLCGIAVTNASAPNAPTVTASSTIACVGSAITFSAPTSSSITYNWREANGNTGTGNTYTITSTPLAPNPYSISVTATNFGCVSQATTITVSVNPTPVATYTIMQDPLPHTWDVYPTFTGGTQPYTYSWNWGDGSPFATTEYPSHIYSVAGTYSICITVTDNNGCASIYCENDAVSRFGYNSTQNSVVYINVINEATTGVNQFANNSNQVSVYPNPATEMLYIECKLKNATLLINDVLGNKIKQLNVESELTSLDISSLSKGVYFLNIKTTDGVITKKFVVQR
jgi:hypothetical protein